MATPTSEGMYDVIIIGGGISGLYTAWRLATSTNLKILVLEATERLGGRFMTCELPGGFVADFGAMRYVPACHPILDALVKHLGVKTQSLIQIDGSKNKFRFFLRNKRVASTEELFQLYSISDEDLPHFMAARRVYFLSHSQQCDLVYGEDGNFETAIFPPTGQPARDVSLSQYLLQTNNVELLNSSSIFFPPHTYPISLVEAIFGLLAKHWHTVSVTEDGYEAIAKSLAAALADLPNVEIRCKQRVQSIAQNEVVFSVRVAGEETKRHKCQKVILACSVVGLESIVLEEQPSRQAVLKEMTSKVSTYASFKIFLTYTRPWWEDAGIFEGGVLTDLPIHECITFGPKGKSNSFATLIAAYSFKDTEIFQSLDLDTNERFVNIAGSVSSELTPSKLLVEHVHNSLKIVMGFPDLTEEPVCAARMFWGIGSYAGTWCYPKCGVNSNQLHWDSLKPFNDAEIYISGDTFTAWDQKGAYQGFAENSLLTSERVLTNYFGLKPFVDGLSVQNVWPSK